MTAETTAPPAPNPKRRHWMFDPDTAEFVEGVPRPPMLLWETVLSVSQTLIVFVGLSVLLLSVLAGVVWWMVALRVAVTIVVLAIIMWFINWLVATGTLEAAQASARFYLERKAQEAARTEANPPRTVELEA